MLPRKKRGFRTKGKIHFKENQKQQEPGGNPKASSKTPDSRVKTMKRGRKRKNASTENKEMQIPSSAVLPARLLSQVSQPIPPVILPGIKKEDPSPLIKKSKIDSIPSNTDVVDTQKNILENHLVSEGHDLTADFEPSNELSFNLNVKSEPVSPVACATNPTFDDPNYVEQNGGNLYHFKIKREPRSRSSSAETVLNEESLQLRQDECYRSSSAETLLNEDSLQSPVDECQSDTSFQISAIYQVINPDNSSLEKEDLSSRKETGHPSFIAPVHSPNISVSPHELQILTTNIPLVIKLFKYNTFNKETAIADAKESLNFLSSSYPSNGSFNFFFSNDTYLGQQEIPAIEPAKSIPIISSTPAVAKDISTDELKKIIEITQKLPSFSIPIKNNSESDNIIKDTNVNPPSFTVSTSHLPILTKQQKESDHIFNPNIRIKEEPKDDYDSAVVIPPSVNHLALTCNKRSAEETSTEMQGFLKRTKISELSQSATSIDSQIEPRDCTGKCNSVDTSKGRMQNQCLENARITSNTLKTITPNSCSFNTVSDNMLQDNATKSHVFSDSGTENRVATDSIVSNSSSKFTSYLHLLPKNIEDNSCTDKAPDSNQRAIVSVEPMTSVGSTVVTTVSDSVVTKNYSQNTTDINRFSTCSTMQHVEETNLGKERNPSDTNVLVACNKINTLNCSQPGIISSDSVTTKNKISPKTYFQRKSYAHFHDPCTQKYIGQNFVSEVSSLGSTVQSIIAPPTNEQNHIRTPIAYTQNNAHLHNKLASAPRFEIGSSVQQIQDSSFSQSIMSKAIPTETTQRSAVSSRNQTQVIEDSNVSPKSSRRSEEISSSISRDPRKTSKSYYQKVFGLPRQNFSSLRSDIEGNMFIETKDLPYIILNWNVNWLSSQKEVNMRPPIWENYLKVKDTYQYLQQYYDTYQPLLLLNIWCDIYQGWEESEVNYNSTLIQVKKEEKFMKLSCTVITSAANRSNRVMEEDILICTSPSAGSIQKYFGRVVGVVEKDWDNSSHTFSFVKPGVYKQLFLEIMCSENFDVHFPAVVKFQNVTNIGVALKQNDALRCMNPVMRAIILNPSENEQLIQTTTVPPIKNVPCMLHSIRTFEHRVTIINTLSPSISVEATLQVALLLKTNSILLVAVKDKEAFIDLALKMKNLNIVLAIREDEVPPELRTRTVNYCDCATLMSRQVILTLIPSMFFGKIESRLKTEPIICIVHEAQCFFETETALLLAYKIEHLILIGMPNVRASTHCQLARYAFDVSLFHRMSKKS